VALYADIRDFLEERGHSVSKWRIPDDPSETGKGKKASKDAWNDLRNLLDPIDDATVVELWDDLIKKRYTAAQRSAAFGVGRSAVSRFFNDHRSDPQE
jgi:hypothetical protein